MDAVAGRRGWETSLFVEWKCFKVCFHAGYTWVEFTSEVDVIFVGGPL